MAAFSHAIDLLDVHLNSLHHIVIVRGEQLCADKRMTSEMFFAHTQKITSLLVVLSFFLHHTSAGPLVIENETALLWLALLILFNICVY